jgi:hypothetical protein
MDINTRAEFFPPLITNDSQIADGVIIAQKITVNELSALSANLGNITAGNITGIVITGGTIQTSTVSLSQNIIISGANNDLILYDASGNQLFNLGSQSSEVVTIFPKDGNAALWIHAPDATYNPLVEVDMNNTSSTGDAVYISQLGTGKSLNVSASQDSTNPVILVSTSNARNLLLLDQSSTVSTISVVKIINSSLGSAFEIDDNFGSSNGNPSLTITRYAEGGGNVIYLYNTAAGSTGAALFINQSGGGPAADFERDSTGTGAATLRLGQAALVGGHFKQFIDFEVADGGVMMYMSDGTTPNGNLSGNVGDICLNGPAGQPFYCTGGVAWTGF